MASQQFLLIVLAVFIIGITVAMGILFFNDQATASNRDGLTNDLLTLSVQAKQYYHRTKSLGGGGKSFEGLTINMLIAKTQKPHGTFSMPSVSPSQIVLQGVGIEKGTDGNPLTVRMTVFSDSTHVEFLN